MTIGTTRTGTGILSLLLCAAALGLPAGCGSDPSSPQGAIPENDVADIVASALGGSSATYGLSAQIDDAVRVAEAGHIRAAKTAAPGFDTTVVRSDTIGLYSYRYVYHLGYFFSFLGNQLEFHYDMRGFYVTPFVSSDDTASGTLTVTDILTDNTQYTLNAQYTRLGSQSSRVRNHNRFTSTITMALNDIRIGKATRTIQSGSGTVTVAGETSDGRSFTYTFSITFAGNRQATIVINGRTFAIDMDAGTASG